MKPISRKERTAYYNGPKVSVASMDGESGGQGSDAYLEDSGMSFIADESKDMSDEEIKIKALKQAIDIAKLMSDVTVDDVISIAEKVAVYIKK